jgi:hypothetical protein
MCLLVQIIVPRYFFMVLNTELKGQEKNKSFEILFFKLNFRVSCKCLARHSSKSRCSIYFAKKNASLTVVMCDLSIGKLFFNVLHRDKKNFCPLLKCPSNQVDRWPLKFDSSLLFYYMTATGVNSLFFWQGNPKYSATWQV